MKKYSVNIKKELTEENIIDLMADGLETGIGYWAMLDNSTPAFEKYYAEHKGMPTSEIAARILMDGGEVIITDAEEETEAVYPLTMERLLKGIEMNAEERPWDCDLDNYDSTTVDCIIQYAIFNDVIFG